MVRGTANQHLYYYIRVLQNNIPEVNDFKRLQTQKKAVVNVWRVACALSRKAVT